MERTVWPISRIYIDFLMLLFVFLSPSFIKRYTNIVERGFFCNDEDIMYPIPQRVTVPSRYLYPMLCSLVVLIIFLNEYLTRSKYREKVNLCCVKLPKWCYDAYQPLLHFLLGLFSNVVVKTSLKGTFGRLRPYFLAVCAPNINCSLPENHHIYHVNYKCTKLVPTNIRTSFPSGHASFTMYCTLFLSIYIQKRINLSKSVKTTFETALLALALHVVSTIVSDYWHHWSDVLAGVILGAGSAVVVSINLY